MRKFLSILISCASLQASVASPSADLENIQAMRTRLTMYSDDSNVTKYVKEMEQSLSDLEAFVKGNVLTDEAFDDARSALNSIALNICYVDMVGKITVAATQLHVCGPNNLQASISLSDSESGQTETETSPNPAVEIIDAETTFLGDLHRALSDSVSLTADHKVVVRSARGTLSDIEALEKIVSGQNAAQSPVDNLDIRKLQDIKNRMYVLAYNPSQFLDNPTKANETIENNLYRTSAPDVPLVLERHKSKVEALTEAFSESLTNAHKLKKEGAFVQGIPNILNATETRVDCFKGAAQESLLCLEEFRDYAFTGVYQIGDPTPHKVRKAHAVLSGLTESMAKEIEFYNICVKVKK